jgi:hypothetical protein
MHYGLQRIAQYRSTPAALYPSLIHPFMVALKHPASLLQAGRIHDPYHRISLILLHLALHLDRKTVICYLWFGAGRSAAAEYGAGGAGRCDT